MFLRIRLEPQAVVENISGCVIPLSVSQYLNPAFTSYTPRSVSQDVTNAIENIADEAECK